MNKQAGVIITPIVIVTAIVILAAISGTSLFRKMNLSKPTQILPLEPGVPTPSQIPGKITQINPESVVTIGQPVNPGVFKGNLRQLPTVSPLPSPVVFSGSPSDIQVSLSKSIFYRGETLEVKVTNKSQKPFTYLRGLSCDITFEQKVNGNWQEAPQICSSCGSAAPCVQNIHGTW